MLRKSKTWFYYLLSNIYIKLFRYIILMSQTKVNNCQFQMFVCLQLPFYVHYYYFRFLSFRISFTEMFYEFTELGYNVTRTILCKLYIFYIKNYLEQLLQCPLSHTCKPGYSDVHLILDILI